MASGLSEEATLLVSSHTRPEQTIWASLHSAKEDY